jgi:hypothetical protein
MKIHYSCSNCGKREITSPVVGVPHGMYALGYRAVGSALYCPKCVRTWKERNGKDFDEQIANPARQFANWWNNQLESQIDDKGLIRTYRQHAIGDFIDGERTI